MDYIDAPRKIVTSPLSPLPQHPIHRLKMYGMLMCLHDLAELLPRLRYVLLMLVMAIGFVIMLLRRGFARRRYYGDAKLTGKVVIITGANTGIGKETAKDLARRGAKVILACRDVTNAERAAEQIRTETGNGTVTVKLLDLASLKSIRLFAKSIIETEPEVNILINNAGVFMCPQQETADGFELQFGTNHLGHFLLTNLLLDLMKKSAPSRIVNVSSFAHKSAKIHFEDLNMRDCYGPFSAYRQSKLANILFTNELARRLEGTKVTCYSLHPGVVRTNLMRHVTSWTRLLLDMVFLLLGNSIEMGAQTTIYCAVEESVTNESGYFYSDCERTEPAPQAQDEEADKKLWKLSTEMVKLDVKLD